MTSEWTAEYVKGSGNGLIEVSSPCFSDGTEENREL
jgi:hypothetical protein